MQADEYAKMRTKDVMTLLNDGAAANNSEKFFSTFLENELLRAFKAGEANGQANATRIEFGVKQ